jgi:hypothetical protein
MATDVSLEQLVAAILDAQTRGNNLLGAMFNQMRADAAARDAQSAGLSNWKSQNPELSERIGQNAKVLNTILEAYIVHILDGIEDIGDPESEFEVREFIDRFGQCFLQLNGLIQTMGQLSS